MSSSKKTFAEVAAQRLRFARPNLFAVLFAAMAVGMGQAADAADSPQTTPSASDSSQAKGTGDNGAVETVTVTAQFRKENLQETPLAITALTGAMLEARSETSLEDVAAQAPNVILQPSPAAYGNSMRAQIRGVGQTDFDPAVDPGVGIYIDDVYFPTLTGSNFALLDLDRVEILRGPQGTLSGMNSLGGSVKLYSQKAAGTNDGYVEATYGNYRHVEVRASGDFALIPDTLFMRLSGVSKKTDGYVQLEDYSCSHPNDPYVISGAIPRGNFTSDCKTGTEGGVDYTAVRASVRWLASSAVEVNWITDATQENDGTDATTLLGTFPTQSLVFQGVPYDNRFVPKNPYVNYANFLDPGLTYQAINVAGAPGAPNGPWAINGNNTLDSWGTSVTVDWRIMDKLTLKSITAYRRYTSGFGDDNSDSPVALVLEQGQFKNRQYSEELRLNGEVLDFLDYTLGGIYFNQLTYYQSREGQPLRALWDANPAHVRFRAERSDPHQNARGLLQHDMAPDARTGVEYRGSLYQRK